MAPSRRHRSRRHRSRRNRRTRLQQGRGLANWASAARNAAGTVRNKAATAAAAARNATLSAAGTVRNATLSAAGTARNKAATAAAAARNATLSAAGTVRNATLSAAGTARNATLSAAAAASEAATSAASRARNVAGSAARTVRNTAGTAASRALNVAGSAASRALTIAGILLQVATFALIGMGFGGYMLYKSMSQGGLENIAPLAKVVFMVIGGGLVGAVQSLTSHESYDELFTNEKLSLLLQNYEDHKRDNNYGVSVLMYLTSEKFNFHDASPKLKSDYIRIVSEILDNKIVMDYYARVQRIKDADKENMMLVLRTQLQALEKYGVIADQNSMNKILLREATKDAE